MPTANNRERRFLVIKWDSRKKPLRKELFTSDIARTVRIYHGAQIRSRPILGLVIVPIVRDCGIVCNLAIVEAKSLDDALFARSQVANNEGDRMLVAVGPISADIETQLVGLAENVLIRSIGLKAIEEQAVEVFQDMRRATLFFVGTNAKFRELAGDTSAYRIAYDGEIRRREIVLAQEAYKLLPSLIEAIEEFVRVAQPALFGDDRRIERSQDALAAAMIKRLVPFNVSLLMKRHSAVIGEIDIRVVGNAV